MILRNFKSNYLILVLTLIFTLNQHEVIGQKDLVDIFLPATVLLKYQSGGSSSGVIVGDSSYLYLVTAKHCLINEKKQIIDSSMIIIYYKNNPEEGIADTLSINLYDTYNQKNLLYHYDKDIAVVVLAKIIGYTKSGKTIFSYTKSIKKLTENSPGGISSVFCLDFNKVDVGNDCLLLGYPLSLKTFESNSVYDFNKPLLRKGAISGKDKLKGTIIVDCPSYRGNSGGPVISSYLKSDSKIGIIGIVSGSILQEEVLTSSYFSKPVSINYNNSGYSIIVPIEYAIELMKFRNTY